MLKTRLADIYDSVLEPHPLSVGITGENVEQVLSDFLAMSILFPHVQAAAHLKIVETCLEENREIPYSCEATAVVGSFLCWDEFGGNYKIRTLGMPGLPKILDTMDFHANLLKADIASLLGPQTKYSYSSATQEFMAGLKRGLSSFDPIERVAYMVAFEMNAAKMISGLYDSLKKVFAEKAKNLLYFEIHIGGDDPAEEYHINMTKRLFEDLVSASDTDRFLGFFRRACELNRDWTEVIKGSSQLSVNYA